MFKRSAVSLSLLLACLCFVSCQITLLPAYNKEIASEISGLGKTVDKFYLIMLTKETSKRDYQANLDSYVDIQVAINALYEKNRVRPLNGNATQIAKNLQEIWSANMEDHRKRVHLTDGIINLNKQLVADLLYAMQVAEKAKQ